MNQPIDFESDARDLTVGQQALAALNALVARHDDLRQRLAEATAKVAELSASLRTLEESELPDAMQSAGVQEFKTASGRKVKLDDFVQAHISEERAPAAYAWLIANDHGGLIKTVVATSFSRGEAARAQEIVALLQGAGLDPELKQSVHASTLKSWVREMARQGNPIPDDLFGVFRGRKAIIK